MEGGLRPPWFVRQVIHRATGISPKSVSRCYRVRQQQHGAQSRRVMHRRSSRVLFLFTVALAGVALAAGAVLASSPRSGKYHWVACGASSPPCPTESVDFSVKKGHPTKIVSFSYYNGRTCGPVSIGKSIRVKSKGAFHYAGTGTDPYGNKVALTVNGSFVSSSKAKGTVVIHAGCQSSKPIKFTAKHQK